MTGQQIDVGDALRGHIEDAIADTTEKYFADAIEASVVLSREGLPDPGQRSACMSAGASMCARTRRPTTPYAAFDVALAHLAKRLRRHKRRLRDHHHRDRETISRVGHCAGIRSRCLQTERRRRRPSLSMTGDNPVIIAENHTVIENLTVSEAVMHLDLADAPAFVFRNSKHGGLGVVCRATIETSAGSIPRRTRANLIHGNRRHPST